MMMRMLHAGGMPVVFDKSWRQPDMQNPGGYYESREFVELPPEGLPYLDLLDGKAVKIVANGMLYWPSHLPAKVIFMERDTWERARSLSIMQRADMSRGNVHDFPPRHEGPAMVDQALPAWRARIFSMPQLDVLPVHYNRVGADPRATAERVQAHLGISLDVAAMAAVYDDRLYRNRAVEPHAVSR